MLQAATIKFLEQLAKNNNKPWFDDHRAQYEAAKEDFEVFVTGILSGLAATEPAFREQKAKDCIFRIYRDVRFSKDKTPYKAHFGAGFSKGGKKFTGAGYYMHLEPGKSFAGGGVWSPEAPVLKAVRQEIDYNFGEFNKIITDKGFVKTFSKVGGEQLKTLPKGYDADNPAIEFLKMKSYVVSHQITDITGKSLTANCLKVFTTMKPFIDFLNKALS